ncbi:MAG: transglutaminase domain-containing protein [Oscillospiraceae bacterium]|nr:transglutaminase domain-containing protein [Oscillospiraceae bacterium]
MKRETILTCLTSTVLSFLLALGAVGCVISGFKLNVENMGLIVSLWLIWALVCSLCIPRKRGWLVLLILDIGAVAALWLLGGTVEATQTLILRIAKLYNTAYGWSIPDFNATGYPPDIPLWILGSLIIPLAARTLCTRHGAWPAICLALLSVISTLVVTDTIPGPGYLFLVFLVVALLALSGTVRRSSAAQANRLIAMAALPLTLALGLLFWAVPKEGYVNRSQDILDGIVYWTLTVFEDPMELFTPEEEETSDPATSARDNLRTAGPRNVGKAAVMDVTSSEGGTIYLRGQDYDSYDSTAWSSASIRQENFGTPNGFSGTVTISTRLNHDVMYLPYYPAESQSLVGGRVVNRGDAMEYTYDIGATPGAVSYTNPTPGRGSHDGIVTGSINTWLLRFVALPDETEQWAEAYLDEILSRETTNAEIAQAIAAYVRQSARYDTNTPRMSSDYEDFAQWFLEESDTGYCVHFATASAVLLRAAGVPARYVTGYVTTCGAGETVTVTADRAHAWVEYYDPAVSNWVVLESTPADMNDPDATDPTRATRPTRPTEAEEETEPRPTRPDREDPVEPEAPAADYSGWWWLAGGGLLLLLLVPLQAALRRSLRRRKQKRGDPNAQALACWQEVQELSRLLNQEPPAALEELALKAKFSQYTLTGAELRCFETFHREARDRLKQDPWYRRFVYRYIYAVM